MLRKLVRDRNCRPVVRGILETLLHYITLNLPKWIARNRDQDIERNTKNMNSPDERIEASRQQTQLQTSCTISQLPEVHESTQGKTRSKIPEKGWSDPQKDRLSSRKGGDQREGDLIPRRLTTFQLLQSKFTRSMPKPPITHRREVGTLSCSREAAGDVGHGQESDYKKDRTRREQGLKRGGSVKDIVAKFAMAQQADNTQKKQPVKPRQIGRGVLLSSLMEQFETMATVCQARDLKCSPNRPTGGEMATCNIKQKEVCHDRRHRQPVDQTAHKQNQHKLMKSKSVGQQLKGHESTNGKEQKPEQAVDKNPEEKHPLTAEPIRPVHSEQKSKGQCLLKHIKNQDNDINVQGWRSGDCGETPATADETSIPNKLKYGQTELLCLTSVTETLLPEPYRLFPQVEAQVNWHVATIMTCSPVWCTCVDSSPKQYSVEASESSHLQTEVPREALKSSQSRSSMAEPASSDKGCSSNPHNEVQGGEAAEGPTPSKETIQTRWPKYVIPFVNISYYLQDVDDQMEGSSQKAKTGTVTPSAATLPPHCDTPKTRFSTNNTEVTHDTTTEEKPLEAKVQEKERGAKEDTTPVNISDTFRLSEDTVDRKTSAETSSKTQPEKNNPKQRPKYTTINYGDPSVKQTYKPKIIRFTDTFTF